MTVTAPEAPASPSPSGGRRLRLLVGGGFVAVAAITALIIALVVGSGGAPKVVVTNVPTPSAADAAACRTLQGLLPESIGDGLHTRGVTPDSPLLHAWGTPAAVLRCGVPRPASYSSTAIPGSIDGIGWYSEQVGDATVFTTLNRSPRVSVALPKAYPIPFDLLVSLSPALKQATQATSVA
jgi:hypothetical protein